MTSAQFAGVTAADGSIALSSLVPVAGEEVDTAYSVEIQVLDNGGYTTDMDYMWNGTGWEDSNDGSAVTDVTFAPGQAIWVFNFTGENVGLQSAGKVITSDLLVKLDNDYGAVSVGNAFPVGVSLADLLPVASGEVDTAYSVEIQILDNGGYTTDADYMWNGSAWEDSNTGEPVTDITFAAGQGLWVFNFTGEDVYLRIPAPELN